MPEDAALVSHATLTTVRVVFRQSEEAADAPVAQPGETKPTAQSVQIDAQGLSAPLVAVVQMPLLRPLAALP